LNVRAKRAGDLPFNGMEHGGFFEYNKADASSISKDEQISNSSSLGRARIIQAVLVSATDCGWHENSQ
jgi:hypothetical protein